MSRNDNKTKANTDSPEDFIARIENEKKRSQAFELLELFSNISGEEPVMWGDAIIGYGQYHYKYDSGREGDFMRTGFSPRAQNFSLYIMSGFSEYEDLLTQLGKHKIGKSCLYVTDLDKIDKEILKQVIDKSLKYMEEKYPSK